MSSDRGGASGYARRRRAIWLLWLAAAAGAVMGAGLAIGANVSGVILAVYGLVLALLVASALVVARRARGRPREEASSTRHDDTPRTLPPSGRPRSGA